MVQQLTSQPPEIEYPDSDGQPMADNTLQFQWIVTIKENLEIVFADHPEVFVAGDLLWYPVQGEPNLKRAPDAMVVFGRPKGYRGSYQQWEEAGIAPQVAFEILSPSNKPPAMAEKFRFYEQYGVEEYYIYDPEPMQLSGWQRQGSKLQMIPVMDQWVSPRLGIKFEHLDGQELRLLRPDGSLFLTPVELDNARKQAERERDQEALGRRQAEVERDQARSQVKQLTDKSEQLATKAEKLAAKLRELGIDPETMT